MTHRNESRAKNPNSSPKPLTGLAKRVEIIARSGDTEAIEMLTSLVNVLLLRPLGWPLVKAR